MKARYQKVLDRFDRVEYSDQFLVENEYTTKRNTLGDTKNKGTFFRLI